jgi:hypothetical protein
MDERIERQSLRLARGLNFYNGCAGVIRWQGRSSATLRTAARSAAERPLGRPHWGEAQRAE